MTRPLDATEKIKAILLKNEIPERQQIKAVASILGIAYVTARQKFAGDRGWSNDQLARIARHFHEPVDDLIPNFKESSGNGVMLISAVPQRCSCETGEPLDNPSQEAFVAYRESDTFVIIPGNAATSDNIYFKVRSLTPLPKPEVAALDDVSEITSDIARSFSKKGIQVKEFVDSEAMLQDAKKTSFEYYILDWRLAHGKTAYQTIMNIRNDISAHVPIIILTGELRTHQSYESEIADLAERFSDIVVLEKPVFTSILANTVYKRLFFGLKKVPK